MALVRLIVLRRHCLLLLPSGWIILKLGMLPP